VNTEFDIAIVGMAGRFPGARNLDEFWKNLAAGVDSIVRLSDQEILDSGVPASYLGRPNYVKAAPVLGEPGHFDAEFFGCPPAEARVMDPQHRLLLELAHEAIEHAGCDPDRFPGRIGVFAGSAMNTYFMNTGLHGRFAEDYISTLIGNDKDFLSTRISYKLNLKGPSVTVQTACSTSMVAVHLARQSLLSEECDLVLAGAVSVRVPHRAGYFYDGGGVVSPDGRVRAFDATANGTVFGSGGGVLVLKRLADALAAGDTIHAVIKGSAVNNDGSEKAGYTAPSVNSQADAILEALGNAGIEADDIDYVEAHGSGTPVGDPIELRALTKAFRTMTQLSGYCALGSVKTNVGHLDAAAAVTGIIKTVLALKHRQLPPSLHFTKANPEIDFPNTPFYVNTQLRDWPGHRPQRAIVMSTGMGGTNACLVLEEAPTAEASDDFEKPAVEDDRATKAHLLVWSARTQSALEQATHDLRDYLMREESASLGDVGYTLQMGRKAFPFRRCLVCSGRQEAIAALGGEDAHRVTASHLNAIETGRRPIVLLLPGIGDHYVGMGRELYEEWPVFREEVDRCAEFLLPHLQADIRTILYPEGQVRQRNGGTTGIDLKQMLAGRKGLSADVNTRTLNQTRFAQPALFTIEYAMARLWWSLGVIPDAIVGHSMGEYVAACLAGVFSLEDALRVVARRASLVNELPPGSMLAVTLSEDELVSLLPDGLSISLINGPRLCVVAGPETVVADFERNLSERSIICRHVANSHAFHSRMLDPIVPALEMEFRKIRLNEPSIPYISNVTGNWITKEEATNPAGWARHANHTARFNDAMRVLWRYQNPMLIEAGPGRTLGVLAMQHPGRKEGGEPVVVSSIRHDYEDFSDEEFLLNSIGRLWVAGVPIQWDGLHRGQRRRRIPLPTYPFERRRYWLEPPRQKETAGDEPKGQGKTILKHPDTARWLYAPSWKRLPTLGAEAGNPASRAKSPEAWLVFADTCGLATALIDKLKSAGHDVTTVRAGGSFRQVDAHAFVIQPSAVRDYESLMHALTTNRSLPDRVIHAWSVTGTPDDQPVCERFNRAQAHGFHGLIHLARALAARGAGRKVELHVISDHIHEVVGTEMLQPEKATLLGPCMVIGQEYPNLRVTSIDVDAFEPEDREQRDAAAGLVLCELMEPAANLFVAHRNGRRWVQSFEPLTPARVGRPMTFREHGVYLLTGGLGGIGTAISEHLAESYHAALVLVGRSTLPDRISWDDWIDRHPAEDSIVGRIRAIRRIETLGGKVLYVSADVADADAMQGVIRQAQERFGKLNGVIHAAGVVGDAGYFELKKCDPTACAIHFAPKIRGLMVLEKVLAGVTLDFCLLMSSLTSILGGIGQAPYAAANLFLDASARRHNRNSSVPWLSVNWDVWRLQERSVRGADPGGTLKELGMTVAEAMDMLETVLARKSAGQIIVSTGDLDARIRQWIKLESLRGPVGSDTSEAVRPAVSGQVRRGTNGEAPRDELEERIARAWREALGVDEVGVHENFAQLGGHSLLAIRIVTELRDAFQIDLPVRALFDAPTIAGLASLVRNLLADELEMAGAGAARELASRG